MRIVCLSDTHNRHRQIEVPPGEILIHSGDATTNGTLDEVKAFAGWFGRLPHKHKIFVAGNHDWLFQRDPDAASKLLGGGITYLQDSVAEIDGLKFYGSPWQPRFYDWAFNLFRGKELAEKWNLIPDDTEILITHGPPYGILDEVETPHGSASHEGCQDLFERIKVLVDGGQLKLHVFGHIHGGYGTSEAFGVRFVNASNCDEGYRVTNSPVVIDL
ncbi:MAG: metallophosphatase domain-containing protein [Acidobacteriota bacterium]